MKQSKFYTTCCFLLLLFANVANGQVGVGGASSGGSGTTFGVGDNVPIDDDIAVELDLTTLVVTTSPSAGSLLLVDDILKYIPDGSSSIDAFVATADTLDGVTIDIVGGYGFGVLDVSFSALVSDSSFGMTVMGSFSTGYNTIASAGDFQGTSHMVSTTANGTVVSGTMSALALPDWLHDLGNWFFPGSLTNNSNVTVLVWSDKTGYYWLPPGETSPSGDSADHVLHAGTWYKIPGRKKKGKAEIPPTGPPKGKDYVDWEINYAYPPNNPGRTRRVDKTGEPLDPAATPAGGSWVPAGNIPLPPSIPTSNNGQIQ